VTQQRGELPTCITPIAEHPSSVAPRRAASKGRTALPSSVTPWSSRGIGGTNRPRGRLEQPVATSEMTRFIVKGQPDGTVGIGVAGPLDAASAAALRYLLDDLKRDRVVVDLSECSCATTAALDVLVDASQDAVRTGGDVQVRASAESASVG
jgi:anti-anti-sigma regulatory factor